MERRLAIHRPIQKPPISLQLLLFQFARASDEVVQFDQGLFAVDWNRHMPGANTRSRGTPKLRSSPGLRKKKIPHLISPLEATDAPEEVGDEVDVDTDVKFTVPGYRYRTHDPSTGISLYGTGEGTYPVSAFLSMGIPVYYLTTNFILDTHQQIRHEVRVLDAFIKDFWRKYPEQETHAVIVRTPHHKGRRPSQGAHITAKIYSRDSWLGRPGAAVTVHVYSVDENPRKGYSGFRIIYRSARTGLLALSEMENRLHLAAANCLFHFMDVTTLAPASELARKRAIDSLPPFGANFVMSEDNVASLVLASITANTDIDPLLKPWLYRLNPHLRRSLEDFEAFVKNRRKSVKLEQSSLGVQAIDKDVQSFQILRMDFDRHKYENGLAKRTLYDRITKVEQHVTDNSNPFAEGALWRQVQKLQQRLTSHISSSTSWRQEGVAEAKKLQKLKTDFEEQKKDFNSSRIELWDKISAIGSHATDNSLELSQTSLSDRVDKLEKRFEALARDNTASSRHVLNGANVPMIHTGILERLFALEDEMRKLKNANEMPSLDDHPPISPPPEHVQQPQTIEQEKDSSELATAFQTLSDAVLSRFEPSDISNSQDNESSSQAGDGTLDDETATSPAHSAPAQSDSGLDALISASENQRKRRRSRSSSPFRLDYSSAQGKDTRVSETLRNRESPAAPIGKASKKAVPHSLDTRDYTDWNPMHPD
ncbi:hypothetical protein NA57DRAFT_58061 [Rhizodiscina lignyota]|uniref:Uncharacterized protein n=1 Tax=Rhizodiscina lignyota TaxID=1504668 RepID=A0A9P4ID46_9PEZI|nr:hypothetical protein NA57DRAFT_58061 [Rhizodiscina lignyota]